MNMLVWLNYVIPHFISRVFCIYNAMMQTSSPCFKQLFYLQSIFFLKVWGLALYKIYFWRKTSWFALHLMFAFLYKNLVRFQNTLQQWGEDVCNTHPDPIWSLISNWIRQTKYDFLLYEGCSKYKKIHVSHKIPR